MTKSTVAVTGAEGFIGSHLVEELVRRGHRVRAMTLYNMWSSAGWLETLPDDVRASVDVMPGDVRDPASAVELLDGAEVVYHLAAIGSVPYSYRVPRTFMDNNSLGTLNILEAARACQTPRVVHTSTSETYGTARTVPINEDHPLQAQSPYAASKIAADKLAESYHLSFALPVVTLRPFNTYGPRQSTRAVIPQIITQLGSGARTIKLGALAPSRDFSYVTDTVAAFISVGTAPASAVLGEVFNCGPGDDVSIGDLAAEIVSLTGASADIVRTPSGCAPRNRRSCGSSATPPSCVERTGWQPLSPAPKDCAGRSNGSRSRPTSPATHSTSTTSDHANPESSAASSFLGGHVRRAARGAGHTVLTAGRSGDWTVRLDLTADPADRVGAMLAAAAPDTVVNCAGAISGSADVLAAANITAVHTLVTALLVTEWPGGAPPRIVHIGSAAEYGGGDAHVPVTEDAPVRPDSPVRRHQAWRHAAGAIGPDSWPGRGGTAGVQRDRGGLAAGHSGGRCGGATPAAPGRRNPQARTA